MPPSDRRPRPAEASRAGPAGLPGGTGPLLVSRLAWPAMRRCRRHHLTGPTRFTGGACPHQGRQVPVGQLWHIGAARRRPPVMAPGFHAATTWGVVLARPLT